MQISCTVWASFLGRWFVVVVVTHVVRYFLYICQKLGESIKQPPPHPFKIFRIGHTPLAAATWSKHFGCICFVVFILACCASCLASGVFGAAVNTKLMCTFLHSLHWLGLLVWQIYPSKHLPRPPPWKWMTASKCAALSAWAPQDSPPLVQIQNGNLNQEPELELGRRCWFHLGNY